MTLVPLGSAGRPFCSSFDPTNKMSDPVEIIKHISERVVGYSKLTSCTNVYLGFT